MRLGRNSRIHGRHHNPAPILLCLGFTAAIALIVFRAVDLTPQVDQNFFFSSGDPQVRLDNAIDREFPESPLIIVAARGDIRSAAYAERIRLLSDDLAGLPGVISVQSLSRGPKDIDDAIKSPLWNRLLIAPNEHSTYMYVALAHPSAAAIAGRLDTLQQRFDRPGFRVTISGVPYVTELIGRNLARDLRVFSVAAIAVFGLVLLIIFRSPWVLLGTSLAAADSSAVTLLLTHLVHIPIGPLTANLSTMVFVMTLSPMVFLTFNYRRLGREAADRRDTLIRTAVRQTIVPSFWSATCMFLGFISLLLVPSTPMRRLGIAGAIGAAAAFVSAYAVYPWFLRQMKPATTGSAAVGAESRLREFFARRHGGIVAAVAIFTLIGAYGLLRLNTDPALPTYFKAGGDIRTGLESVDRDGGSSPLKLVIEDAHHAPLNNGEAYHRLWTLQDAIERDPAVGSVVSLAMVLGEAKRPWLSRFLSTEHIIKILDTPKYGDVSRQLIARDGSKTLLILRMRESGRQVPRRLVIARLESTIAHEGFRTVQVGGAYNLLNEMARLLTSSIISGVILLVGIFVVMGFAFSRSLRVAGAMLVSLAIIPVVVRGYIAYLGMPLDFITASAANLDLGMGVDAMIYLTMSARSGGNDRGTAWSRACSQLWKPIGTSLLMICCGFGIFLLSNFPPTQRFGLFVILGSATAAIVALFVFPWLASPGRGTA